MRDYYPFFVYGTLMPGQSNDHTWRNAIVKSFPAELKRGRLYDLGRYPMMLNSECPKDRVKGSLIYVADSHYNYTLAALDELEGYNPNWPEGSFYVREVAQVQLKSGRKKEAWVYFGQPSYAHGHPQIESGCWSTHRQSRRDIGIPFYV